jgi:hypothetical protein
MTASHPLKKGFLWVAILCCGLMSAYLVFLCAISVWVGLAHRDRPGFWVPLLAGGLALPLIMILCRRIVRWLRHLMMEEDVLRR